MTPMGSRRGPRARGGAVAALPWIAITLLTAAAAVRWGGQSFLLLGLLLFLPLLDRGWALPSLPRMRGRHAIWAVLAAVLAATAWFFPSQRGYALETLVFAAIPEEWFFRGYLLDRLGRNWRANLVVSVIFALLHGLSRNWTNAALVFAPSLFFGWLYLRTRDLPLVVLVHALGNLLVAVAWNT